MAQQVQLHKFLCSAEECKPLIVTRLLQLRHFTTIQCFVFENFVIINFFAVLCHHERCESFNVVMICRPEEPDVIFQLSTEEIDVTPVEQVLKDVRVGKVQQAQFCLTKREKCMSQWI